MAALGNASPISPDIRVANGVVLVMPPSDMRPDGHDYASLVSNARRLAELKRFHFAGQVGDDIGSAHAYLVPGDTIVGVDRARMLGVHSIDDLFGGVVPAAYIATKVITHPLVDTGSTRPPRWNTEFSRAIEPVVLPGFSAFSRRDAVYAARRLLRDGPVRIKEANSKGGHGQVVVASMEEVVRKLEGIADQQFAIDGVVLERNLADPITVSVGQVHVGNLVASYWGTQVETRNAAGRVSYGGSRLRVVRGGFEVLLERALDERVRAAVQQACRYDVEAHRAFPGLFASRRNYDVVQGRDANGKWDSGVLEQSWRVGGASGAEIEALEAFASDASLNAVSARTVEVFGDCRVPKGAHVSFRGADPTVGQMVKYSILERDVDPR